MFLLQCDHFQYLLFEFECLTNIILTPFLQSKVSTLFLASEQNDGCIAVICSLFSLSNCKGLPTIKMDYNFLLFLIPFQFCTRIQDKCIFVCWKLDALYPGILSIGDFK